MSRVITHKKLAVGSLVLTTDLYKFKAPNMKKKMVDAKGTYINRKRRVGYEALEWEATLQGADERLIRNALGDGKNTICIYNEIGESEDGSKFNVQHTMTGEVEVEIGDSEVGENLKDVVIRGVSVDKYKHTDTGTTISDFDINNGDYTIGTEKIDNTLR